MKTGSAPADLAVIFARMTDIEVRFHGNGDKRSLCKVQRSGRANVERKSRPRDPRQTQPVAQPNSKYLSSALR